MALTWQQLIAHVKKDIHEVPGERLEELIQQRANVAIIDVRERDDFMNGHLPGAVFIPRGFLELRIENTIPDRNQPIYLYCGGGNRSALAARSLKEMGYQNVFSLQGGYSQWVRDGRQIQVAKERD